MLVQHAERFVMLCSKSASICDLLGVLLFDALVRGESSHPVAQNLVTINYRLYAVMRLKPGVSISPGLGSVPGRDRWMDGQTELR